MLPYHQLVEAKVILRDSTGIRRRLAPHAFNPLRVDPGLPYLLLGVPKYAGSSCVV